MPGEVMTVEEVAKYLGLSKPTVYKLARRGEIPAVKVGRSWRFHREAVELAVLPPSSWEGWLVRLRERLETPPSEEELAQRRHWAEQTRQLREEIARRFPHQTDSVEILRRERCRRMRQLAPEDGE